MQVIWSEQWISLFTLIMSRHKLDSTYNVNHETVDLSGRCKQYNLNSEAVYLPLLEYNWEQWRSLLVQLTVQLRTVKKSTYLAESLLVNSEAVYLPLLEYNWEQWSSLLTSAGVQLRTVKKSTYLAGSLLENSEAVYLQLLEVQLRTVKQSTYLSRRGWNDVNNKPIFTSQTWPSTEPKQNSYDL